MWRHFIPAVGFLAFGALFAFALVRIGQGKLDVHEIKSPLIGKPAPGFALPSVTDPTRRIDSKALAGRMYAVNVWGTWCAGCREEHSALMAIARSTALPIIGIDWKDDSAQARQYLAQLGNPYREVVADSDGRVAIDWGVYGAPETFLVSPAGVILAKYIGPLSEALWAEKFGRFLQAGGGS